MGPAGTADADGRPVAAAAQASPAQGEPGPGDRGKELPVVVPPGSAKSRTNSLWTCLTIRRFLRVAGLSWHTGLMCRLSRYCTAECGWVWLGDCGRWQPIRLPIGLPGHRTNPPECGRARPHKMQVAEPRSRQRNGRTPFPLLLTILKIFRRAARSHLPGSLACL